MAVTLKEIAEKAGVSPATVSLAIRGKQPGKRNLSPETVSQICTVAKQMGYRANRVAASLAYNKTHTIGVLVAALRGDFYERILGGIKKQMYPNYIPVLAVHNYDGSYERTELEVFIGNHVDGVIAAFSGDRQSIQLYREMSEKYRIPIVLIDRGIEGLDLPVVRGDHFASTYQEVISLHKLGHTKISYVTYDSNLESVVLCRKGYSAAISELKLHEKIYTVSSANVNSCNDKSIKKESDEILNLWQNSNPRSTAMIVNNDWIAYEILAMCKIRNISVPEELSIMGLDDCDPSAISGIDLSTARINLETMGVKSAELLLKLINDEKLNEKKVILQPEIVLRKTTKSISC